MDKVSILIPCYNVEKYLPACLNSILNQTYPYIQIHIYDDGSTDKTTEICRNFSKTDSRIVYRSDTHKGVAHARNELIKDASGAYSLFVDSDDWLEPNTIEILINQATNNGLDMVMCHIANERIANYSLKPSTRKFLYDSARIEIWSKKEAIRRFLIHNEITGSLCNKLLRTEYLKKNHIPTEFNYAEDVWLTWNLINDIDRIGVIPTALYHYRNNKDSITHRVDIKDRITSLRIWHDIFKEVNSNWKDFNVIANARVGLESLYVLLNAGIENVRFEHDIKAVHSDLRKRLWHIIRFGHSNWKEMVKALCISISYSFAGIYRKYKKIN